VTDEGDSGELPPPWFHQDTGAVRFWVAIPEGKPMGAILSAQVLHFRFHTQADGSDAVAAYHANRSEIDAVVMRRVAGGSIEPVIVRENDLLPLSRP
jgi:hypothetical protein